MVLMVIETSTESLNSLFLADIRDVQLSALEEQKFSLTSAENHELWRN